MCCWGPSLAKRTLWGKVWRGGAQRGDREGSASSQSLEETDRQLHEEMARKEQTSTAWEAG